MSGNMAVSCINMDDSISFSILLMLFTDYIDHAFAQDGVVTFLCYKKKESSSNYKRVQSVESFSMCTMGFLSYFMFRLDMF